MDNKTNKTQNLQPYSVQHNLRPVVWVTYPINRDQPCCAKAKQVSCVCRVSYQCADHGTRCHGSHD